MARRLGFFNGPFSHLTTTVVVRVTSADRKHLLHKVLENPTQTIFQAFKKFGICFFRSGYQKNLGYIYIYVFFGMQQLPPNVSPIFFPAIFGCSNTARCQAGSTAVMPCVGWAGSNYGNRRINSEVFNFFLGRGKDGFLESRWKCPIFKAIVGNPQIYIYIHLVIQSVLFGMVKWPPTRGWKGHFELPGCLFFLGRKGWLVVFFVFIPNLGKISEGLVQPPTSFFLFFLGCVLKRRRRFFFFDWLIDCLFVCLLVCGCDC